ncbi:flagellar basal body-associated FliL family protein [Phaeobacter marinintestinus]|uniref:flagellar basal body-associated FliL family protein n=1 Tax=Falsiphaeobacter marinintestinus TaxID=1492905 RepID=UPI0011B5C337|nr:flagellar basal body-associated FliL family protein [Phaeobacter marinintestinus]
MTDSVTKSPELPTKSGKFAILIWVFLALTGAGAGFAAISFGLLPFGGVSSGTSGHKQDEHAADFGDIAFVEIEPIMISLNSGAGSRQLRFRAQVEVDSSDKHAVEQIMPRIVDVLNGYLRALTLDDLRDPLALTRLRSQMLRRISIVTGDAMVRDLLIMEFVLN